MLGVQMESLDELGCLVKGLGFLMVHVPSEAYTFAGAEAVDRPMDGISYPYLLANVGSGVSFIVVRSEHDWERVSGTSLGGATFYGLCRVLTGLVSFDEMLGQAELGNNAQVGRGGGGVGGEWRL
jgi:pantothenate kinase